MNDNNQNKLSNGAKNYLPRLLLQVMLRLGSSKSAAKSAAKVKRSSCSGSIKMKMEIRRGYVGSLLLITIEIAGSTSAPYGASRKFRRIIARVSALPM